MLLYHHPTSCRRILLQPLSPLRPLRIFRNLWRVLLSDLLGLLRCLNQVKIVSRWTKNDAHISEPCDRAAVCCSPETCCGTCSPRMILQAWAIGARGLMSKFNWILLLCTGNGIINSFRWLSWSGFNFFIEFNSDTNSQNATWTLCCQPMMKWLICRWELGGPNTCAGTCTFLPGRRQAYWTNTGWLTEQTNRQADRETVTIS